MGRRDTSDVRELRYSFQRYRKKNIVLKKMCITRVSFLFSFISFYLLEYRMQGICDAVGNKNERYLNNKLESEFKRLSSEKQYLNNSWPLSDAREICSDGRGSRYRIFLAKGSGGNQLPFFRRRPARFVERVY